MFGMGAQELMVILVIVLVLSGGRKLPDLATPLRNSKKEFTKGIATEDEEPAAKPAASVSASPAPQRVCGSCKGALDAAWTHCPSCGAPAPQTSAPQTPAPKA
jgi:sec-independent protein translocase protein TatA